MKSARMYLEDEKSIVVEINAQLAEEHRELLENELLAVVVVGRRVVLAGFSLDHDLRARHCLVAVLVTSVVHNLLEIHRDRAKVHVTVVLRVVNESAQLTLSDLARSEASDPGHEERWEGVRFNFLQNANSSQRNGRGRRDAHPKTNNMASITLDFPDPLGPTTEEKHCVGKMQLCEAIAQQDTRLLVFFHPQILAVLKTLRMSKLAREQ